MNDTTDELLAQYIDILNEFGFESEEEERFLTAHKNNQKLQRLFCVSKRIKKALVFEDSLHERSVAGKPWEV